MLTTKQVIESLEAVIVPGVNRSLVKLNLVRDVRIEGGKISVTLASIALASREHRWFEENISDAVNRQTKAEEVNIEFADDKPKDINQIDRLIAVMSSKGGVGKTLISSLIAVVLKCQDYEVGILDADLTASSIPKLFGIETKPANNPAGFIPVSSKSGIEVASINLLQPRKDNEVIWHSPMIGIAITQLWERVLWGKLDYLIIDLPPGIADIPLTVLEALPVSGIIVVFTPQNLAAEIIRREVKIAKHMDTPVLGLIENMSYLYIPEIKSKVEPFGRSQGEELAVEIGVPLLGKFPIDPQLVELCNEGNIENYNEEIMTTLKASLSDIIPASS